MLDPAGILTLAAEPWRDRDGFAARLAGVLGEVSVDMPRLPAELREDDPFLWSLTGQFGTPLEGVETPGGIFACSRYGIATRDRLAGTRLTDPTAFALFGATLAAHDDAAAWPAEGVARLACMITWDDTRRVAIIPEEPATLALAARFEEVTRRGDAETYGDGWQLYRPLYGADGYHLEGRGGERTSVLLLDSAVIALTVGHQVIRFRAFLLNGGV